MFIIGDIVTTNKYPGIKAIVKRVNCISQNYTFEIINKYNIWDAGYIWEVPINENKWYKISKSKGDNMLKEVSKDVKQFVSDNRNVVYTIALIVLVDHFLLGGKFRERLTAMCEKLLNKAEAKVDLVK
jgi:hypothetical protein